MALEMPGASQPTPLKEISSRDLEEAGFYGLPRRVNGFGVVICGLLSHMVTLILHQLSLLTGSRMVSASLTQVSYKALNTSKVVFPRCPASRCLYESEWTNHKDGVADAKTTVIYSNNGTGLLPDFDTKI